MVISRQVEPGQTVAASLNTPTLFTIAQDLREMQVDVAIDESDIGRIRADQRATFTVDAFPGRTFEGRCARSARPRRRCRTSSPTSWWSGTHESRRCSWCRA